MDQKKKQGKKKQTLKDKQKLTIHNPETEQVIKYKGKLKITGSEKDLEKAFSTPFADVAKIQLEGRAIPMLKLAAGDFKTSSGTDNSNNP